jgi:fumarylacetoacetate (FAA) hydrolase family protein
MRRDVHREHAERVIEEQAKGDPAGAEAIRKTLLDDIGGELRAIKPGSPEAMRVKDSLIKRDMWSQYLEVGIGPTRRCSTKRSRCPPSAPERRSVVLSASSWNNPEPELVLVNHAKAKSSADARQRRQLCATSRAAARCCSVAPRTTTRAARSARSSGCSIGTTSVDDLRRTRIEIRVQGTDGFSVEGNYSLTQISRDPLDLVAQAVNRNHQYPDRHRAVPGNGVRAHARSRRARARLHAQPRRRRDDPLGAASVRCPTASTIAIASSRGISA